MHETLLGLPVEVVAVICFGVAGLYTILWPRPPRSATTSRGVWQHLVLRWFHAVTWVCLALAALTLKYVGVTAAQLLGILGLLSYLTFMAVFVREKMQYPNG